MDFNQVTLPTDLLDSQLYRDHDLDVHLIRADQLHPQISGNKWYKLKYTLQEAKLKQCPRLISFGGAYSNHIHALAYAAKQFDIPCTGFIRGQWSDDNQTLADAQRWGMELVSLDRACYRDKNSPEFLQALERQYPGSMVIPEGGSNILALRGGADLMNDIESALPSLDYLVSACGTGGTLAGLLCAAPAHLTLLGIPVLKGAGFLSADIYGLLERASNHPKAQWQLDLDGHYGGYGKVKVDHLAAMMKIEQTHSLLLDPVYTAKMWRRFDELVALQYFKRGSKVALIHSGGLQGRRGFGLEVPVEYK